MTKRRQITNWNEVPLVMTIEYAGLLLGGITPETLKARARKGTFPAYKEGALWLVRKDSLIAYMDECEGKAQVRKHCTVRTSERSSVPLDEKLGKGWRVVMANQVGSEVEYILEADTAG